MKGAKPPFYRQENRGTSFPSIMSSASHMYCAPGPASHSFWLISTWFCHLYGGGRKDYLFPHPHPLGCWCGVKPIYKVVVQILASLTHLWWPNGKRGAEVQREGFIRRPKAITPAPWAVGSWAGLRATISDVAGPSPS